MSAFASKIRSVFRPAVAKPKKRTRLELEALEDRLVPTVVFTPKFGAETLNAPGNGAASYTTLNHPTVNLIFWGSYWTDTTGAGPSQAKTLKDDLGSLISGPYLSALQPYDANWRPQMGGVWFDDKTSAPAGFTAGDLFDSDPTNDPAGVASMKAIQAEIKRAIETPGNGIAGPGSGTSLANAPIYIVITDPAHAGGNGGYNTDGTYKPDGASQGTPINIISVGTATKGLLNGASSGMSHELAERISDPTDPGGVTLTYPSGIPAYLSTNVGNQIGDGEPAGTNISHYRYRLGGAKGFIVQPVWYSTGGKGSTATLEVQDGNSQTVTLTPIWNATGDDATPYKFQGHYNLTINAIRASNELTIDSSAAGVQVTLNGEKFFFDSGTIDNISVLANGRQNTINIPELAAKQPLDIESGAPSTVTVGNGSTSNLNSTISVNALTSNPVTLIVDDSSDNSGPTATVAMSSTGGQLTGLPGSAISFSPSGVNPTVKIGTGSLTVDDSASTQDRSISIDKNAVTVGNSIAVATPTTVTFSGKLSTLKVVGGQGDDTIQVNSTTAGAQTTIATGTGKNSVFIGKVGMSAQADQDYTRGWTRLQKEFNLLWRHSLADIAGPVNVQANASGKTSLTVDDSGEVGRGTSVSSNAVVFNGLPTIKYSGISSLTLVAGTENPWIYVGSVPSGAPVTVYNDMPGHVYGPAASQVKVISGLPSWDGDHLLPYYAYVPQLPYRLPTPDPYYFEIGPAVEQNLLTKVNVAGSVIAPWQTSVAPAARSGLLATVGPATATLIR
jgi:hypothetical protein